MLDWFLAHVATRMKSSGTLLTRTTGSSGWLLATLTSAVLVVASSCVEEENDACLFWQAGATLTVSDVPTGTKLPVDEGITLNLEASVAANGESYTAKVSFELTAERYRLVVTPGTEVRVGGELLSPTPACGDGEAYTISPSVTATTEVTLTSLEPNVFIVVSRFFKPSGSSNGDSSSGSGGDADFDFD